MLINMFFYPSNYHYRLLSFISKFSRNTSSIGTATFLIDDFDREFRRNFNLALAPRRHLSQHYQPQTGLKLADVKQVDKRSMHSAENYRTAAATQTCRKQNPGALELKCSSFFVGKGRKIEPRHCRVRHGINLRRREVEARPLTVMSLPA